MEKTIKKSVAEYYDKELALMLSKKIQSVYPVFNSKDFTKEVVKNIPGKSYKYRVEIFADLLKKYLPEKYTESLKILIKILGPENKEETGMFKNFYWLTPVGKFIEKYGLNNFDASIKAIGELTKRNTGEYAIRPFAHKEPNKVVEICKKWAKSENFHLRRLASEGLRPKLPWAPKIDIWKNGPKPIFEILEILKEDEIKFVKKSVANHLRDWIKVNQKEADKIIKSWSKSKNENTKWILKHAQR